MAVTETTTRATSAVDDLYRRHVGDVYRYTYAVLGNHADAEDVTQTTFVNALRALERGEVPRNASSWLLAIAHNLVRQRWRQAAARPTEVELAHDVPDGARDDDVELDGLVKALQRIPPAQREALVMRELEGRSYREISELLFLSTSALETLLFRARRSLADELENVVTCQSAELALSRRLDGRLGRKERRRLLEHLDECRPCARLAEMQTKQRRAFKGLALLPLPVGLALFKGAPAATASVGLPTIGGLAAGATGTGSASTAGAGAAGLGAATLGSAGAGGGAAAVGGSLVGGVAAKVAAVVVAAGVATGVGYEGVQAVRESPSTKTPSADTRSRSSSTSSGARTPSGAAGKARAKAASPTSPVRARGSAGAPGRLKRTKPPGTRTGLTHDRGRSSAKARADRERATNRSERTRTTRAKADRKPLVAKERAAKKQPAERTRPTAVRPTKESPAPAANVEATTKTNGNTHAEPSTPPAPAPPTPSEPAAETPVIPTDGTSGNGHGAGGPSAEHDSSAKANGKP